MHDDAENIRHQVLWWREHGDSMRYPAELRRRVTDHARHQVEAGVSVATISRALAMRKVTLPRWLKASAESTPPSSALIPVRMAQFSAPEPTAPSGRHNVTSPSG